MRLMSPINRLRQFLSRNPRITIMLTWPEGIENKGWKHVSCSTDALEFMGSSGLFHNDHIFRGELKVDVQ